MTLQLLLVAILDNELLIEIPYATGIMHDFPIVVGNHPLSCILVSVIHINHALTCHFLSYHSCLVSSITLSRTIDAGIG